MTTPTPTQKPRLVPMFRLEGCRADGTWYDDGIEMIYLRLVNRFGPIDSARLLAGEVVVRPSGWHRLLGARLVEQPE